MTRWNPAESVGTRWDPSRPDETR